MDSKKSLLVFKVVAWYISIYHAVLALIGTFAGPETVGAIAARVYGITPYITAQFAVTAKFASAYMLAFAVMMGLVAYSPEKYRVFIYPAIVLFLLRIFDRIVYAGQINEAFGTTMSQNMVTIVIAAACALLLYAFRPSAR